MYLSSVKKVVVVFVVVVSSARLRVNGESVCLIGQEPSG